MSVFRRPEFEGVAAIFRQAWGLSRGTVSLQIVMVCTVFFIAVTVLEALHILSPNATAAFLGLSYYGIVERHWFHQFLTAPLMHGGVSHLLFNMLSLWMLGPSVELTLGRRQYMVFSVICALASMGGSLLLNWGTGGIILGYSGVIFGILVAQAIFFPDSTILLYVFPVKMKYAAWILGAIELLLTVSPERGDGIAHAAHLFGGVAAYGYLFWFRRTQSRKPQWTVGEQAPQTVQLPKFRPRPRATPLLTPKERSRSTRIPDIPKEL